MQKGTMGQDCKVVVKWNKMQTINLSKNADTQVTKSIKS